jgi:23S rRNA (uracil1939-C5)-methyltransferase
MTKSEDLAKVSLAQVLEVGQTYEVEAVRLNDDGDAVASIQGVTVFVPHLLPGERATVEITHVERRFARAAIVERHGEGSSGDRVAAMCSVFGLCGGCSLQHLSYEAQLRHKQNVVRQALLRTAKLPDVTVHPTLGMKHPWRYRNQVQVPLRYDKDAGKIVTGFYAPQSHRIVPTNVCHLEPDEMEATVASAADVVAEVLGGDAAHIHHLIARRSWTTGEQMLVLVSDRDGLEWTTVAKRLGELPHVVSVAYTVQPNRGGPVWGKTVHVVWGKAVLTEVIEGMEYLISPRSFFQVNTEQARVLYQKTLAYAQVTPDDTVLDAYCGTGTISTLLARHAKRVIGIESIPAAVEDAKRNAKHNGIDNAEFLVGEVERVLPPLVAKGLTLDVAVLDPPRSGCDQRVLDAVIQAKPRRIVYVSCNHATLARDLRRLVDGGYQVMEVQPVDMFPQTSHVECVVLLKLKAMQV